MMKTHVLSGILLILLCLAGWHRTVMAQESETPQFVLIGHPSVPESLAKDEIKQIFLGRMTRKDGNPIGFIIFKEDPVYAVFLKAYVNKTITQYTNYWKKQVFTGKGRMPKMFQTPEDVLEHVASHEGTISFLAPDDLPQDEVVEDVHIVTVTE